MSEPRGWWSELYDDDTEPEADVRVNVTIGRAREQTLKAADHAVGLARAALPDGIRSDRLRHLAYNAAAAWAGWLLGIVDWASAGIAHYGAHSTQRGVWVGIGLCLLACGIEWRTHGLRAPGRHTVVRVAGWAARIPLASTALALALWAQPL
ncbi:hypothetical protein [Streptomyces marianii]|uniref:Uncharacterized protein n=1 Tax=Streptomyces marianii TaxID=1817406 RepID=A0A5R9ECT0_9ACTN|nr:hypothetical protein [Streptomyces marianii]TLQ45773.1 hypothetical protein FEF34_24745 [Streptomyces marianii]